MDAISFVFGLPAKYLRGRSLKDLIYNPGAAAGIAPADGAGDGDSADVGDGPRRASVKIVYTLDVEECEELGLAPATSEIEFSRVITADGTSTYRIGNSSVNWERYKDSLAKLRIMVSARNFLVFQVGVGVLASVLRVQGQ